MGWGWARAGLRYLSPPCCLCQRRKSRRPGPRYEATLARALPRVPARRLASKVPDLPPTNPVPLREGCVQVAWSTHLARVRVRVRFGLGSGRTSRLGISRSHLVTCRKHKVLPDISPGWGQGWGWGCGQG
eukprot:scaffold89664_cov49-Phaeocystis_antarctica.AAC.1